MHPLPSGDREVVAVEFPAGQVRRVWQLGGHGVFVDGGRGMCGDAPGTASKREVITCWDVDSGRRWGDIPVAGGWPLTPASAAPRVVASDLRHHRIILTDAEWWSVHRRVLWDYSDKAMLAMWSPSTEKYLKSANGRTVTVDVPFPCALSPDGLVVAEAGNGVLRLYRVGK